MTTVETYVCVPFAKYTQLENAALDHTVEKKPDPEPTPLDPIKEENETPGEDESVPDPEVEENGLSSATKHEVKKQTLLHTHLTKFLKAIELYGGEALHIPNLDSLAKQALGQSKRMLDNEEEFYQFISKHGLSHMVKNRHKIAR